MESSYVREEIMADSGPNYFPIVFGRFLGPGTGTATATATTSESIMGFLISCCAANDREASPA